MKIRSHITVNIAVVCVSALLALVAIEVAVRYRIEVPILSTADLRGDGVMIFDTTDAVAYDPFLGWVQKSNFRSPGFNTISFGIRRNFPHDSETFEPGSILAVGDSFTAGSDVGDQETWPAQLSSLTNIRVINAGIGGYGVDQSVLRAEFLTPIVKPSLIILGIFEQDIQRSAFSSYGAPKPFFLEKNGAWHLENSPVPTLRTARREPFYKLVLVRLATAHIIMNRVGFSWWYSNGRTNFTLSGEDASRATCHSIRRLAALATERDIRVVAVFQYSAATYRKNVRPQHVAPTIQCAKAAGMIAVDEFPTVQNMLAKERGLISHYYVHERGIPGHLSRSGNHNIAELIFGAVNFSASW